MLIEKKPSESHPYWMLNVVALKGPFGYAATRRD